MAKAFSYLRFSTPEQAKGDSTRRQSEMARVYAAKRGLILEDSPTFHDLGVSAFRGRNAETGRLAAFLEAVREGLVEKGSYLLVESLDRVSRQTARKALRVLESIVDEGVTVVTLNDEKAYDADRLDEDPMALVMVVMGFTLANDESRKKSTRIRAVRENERRAARETGRPMTARAPAWLKLRADRLKFDLIPERAAVVKRVFELTTNGRGPHAVAEMLNRDGVPVFGSGKHWHRSYVVKLLRNPAVLGTCVPHTIEHEEGRKRRKPAGVPMPDHFPAAVDRELWESARAQLESRSSGRGRHAARPLQNVLGGLARCPLCRGTMTRKTGGSGVKAGKPYLVCAAAKAGAGCQYRAVRLDGIELTLWEQGVRIAHEAPDSSDEAGKLRGQLAGIDVEIDEVQDRLHRLDEALGEAPSQESVSRIKMSIVEGEERLKELGAQTDELWRRIWAVESPFVRRRLDNLGAATTAAKRLTALDVPRVNAALRETVSDIVVNYPHNELEFHWRHGGVSHLPYYSSAAPSPEDRKWELQEEKAERSRARMAARKARA